MKSGFTVEILQRLGNFYRYHCQKIVSNKARAICANPIDPRNIFRAGVGAPRRQQLLQVYSNVYYDEVIKPKMIREQARLKEEDIQEPFLTVLQRVTKMCWEEESEDVHKEVEDTVESIYKDAMAEYEEQSKVLGKDSVAA
jgi:hypothetical protein